MALVLFWLYGFRMKPERQAASADGVCRRKGGAGRGVSPVLHKLLRGNMGIRPAPFIEDPCGCEGFTPESEFVIFISMFAKGDCYPHGRRRLVRLRELASKAQCAACRVFALDTF